MKSILRNILEDKQEVFDLTTSVLKVEYASWDASEEKFRCPTHPIQQRVMDVFMVKDEKGLKTRKLAIFSDTSLLFDGLWFWRFLMSVKDFTTIMIYYKVRPVVLNMNYGIVYGLKRKEEFIEGVKKNVTSVSLYNNIQYVSDEKFYDFVNQSLNLSGFKTRLYP